MSLSRRLPTTDVARNVALKSAMIKKTSVAPADMAITPNTKTRLETNQPIYLQLMDERGNALQAQSQSTAGKLITQAKGKMFISHFVQTFNNGVDRGVYLASHRAFYKLDVNSSSVPPLIKEADIIYWGEQLINGDAARITAGGAPMSNPTILEVKAEYDKFVLANTGQSTLKDDYDKAQEAVSAMNPEVDKLILKIWDEVETFYNEEELSSKRRNAREWGVVYVSTMKSTINGTVINAVSAEPLANVNVALLESDNIVQTGPDGKYTLVTTHTGAGTLEFSLDGYITQTISVEIAEGSTLKQDAKLTKV